MAHDRSNAKSRSAQAIGKLAAIAALTVFSVGPIQAGVVFFANNPAGFAAAMSGNTLLGTETFEESTLAPASLVSLNDPLTQGVPNGPYPAGLLQPMTVQSNQSGGAAVAPNPRGVNGLVASSAGLAGATSDVVIANFLVDSLDWIFATATQIAGVGLNPLSFPAASVLEVEVYDTSNVLLGATTITGNPAGTNFLGIQATGGDLVGRINFFSTASPTSQAEGGDNAMLFVAATPSQVPEPGSLALLGIALGAFALSRRRKQI